MLEYKQIYSGILLVLSYSLVRVIRKRCETTAGPRYLSGLQATMQDYYFYYYFFHSPIMKRD